ncbi:MAG TPA: methyltransferase domain-containing protein [Chloroflexia bacterium]
MPATPREQRIRTTLLRTAFALLYTRFAWAYDWVSRTFFHGEWRRWQRAALEPLAGLPGGRVLEVGFGTGDLQADLRAAGYRAYGIDLSPQMLRVARHKAQRTGAAPLWVARATATALPFSAATFDAVVSTFPSEYIFDPRTLREILRVLRPGGPLVIVPGGVLLPVDPTSQLLQRFAALVYGQGYRRAGDHATRRQAILDALQHSPGAGPLLPNLRATGFQVQTYTGISPRSVVLVVVARKPAA